MCDDRHTGRPDELHVRHLRREVPGKSQAHLVQALNGDLPESLVKMVSLVETMRPSKVKCRVVTKL